MYNSLEAAVARILVKNQIPYAYEKTVMVPNKNGFISIDFALPGAVFVEATYWDDVKTKAAKLNAKYALLKKAIPNARLTVVTKPKFEVSLRRFLEKDINVQSLESFRHMVSLG